MRLSTLIPSPILRTIDGLRARRRLAITAPITVEYTQRYGLEVRYGPFVAMRYGEDMAQATNDLVSKLTGSYERELHGAVTEWIASDLEHVIDVGCAEGYYAVGFALKIPGATVHAFDIDPTARERCAAMAELNGVAGRVRVAGACNPSSFDSFPQDGVALFSDCEGAELALLDPALAPRLQSWPIIVELHDFGDSTITTTICERFAPTHEISIIQATKRHNDVPVELSFATTQQRSILLSERPQGMSWAHMRPRSLSA